MKRWRNSLLLLAGASALGLAALPAVGQDAVLPPGFGDPNAQPKQQQPAAEPEPQVAEPEPTDVAEPTDTGGSSRPSAPRVSEEPDVTDSAPEDLRPARPVRPAYTYDIAPENARPLDVVGVLQPGNQGLGLSAFGPRGAFAAELMRRLEGPVPSRWTSMLLRRALLSRVATPPGVHPVNWVAERAALLLRMGEADAARALVQSVDVVQYTPRMVQVALDTALATSDPAALCPLIEPGRSMGDQPIWGVADAMCAAMAGEGARAASLSDQARSRGRVTGPDLLLAEKVIGAGIDSRRSATIEWDEVENLTPWRFGLATATGSEIPDNLIGSGGPAMRAWYARAPMVPVERRLAAADSAAVLGVFSSASLVEMQSLVFERADQNEVNNTPAGRLRIAYAHRDVGQRMEALRDLWDDGEGADARYARSILTAVASAGIPAAAERAEYADELIVAMLSAGLDDEAARWTDFVGDADPLAAALLAVGAPAAPADAAGAVSAFQEADESEDDRATAMLVAALAGLDRMPLDDAAQLASGLGHGLGGENAWTRALDAAVRDRETGTVALLAAIGMQSGSWEGVPPSHLFRITRALRVSGMEFEARMIAAEALSRLSRAS